MKHTIEIDIDSKELLRLLCEELDIDNVVYSDRPMRIKGGIVQEQQRNGRWVDVDDRPYLFVSLRNVVKAIYPNCEFRSDDYITDYEFEDGKNDLPGCSDMTCANNHCGFCSVNHERTVEEASDACSEFRKILTENPPCWKSDCANYSGGKCIAGHTRENGVCVVTSLDHKA